jgi:hypothetical protein
VAHGTRACDPHRATLGVRSDYYRGKQEAPTCRRRPLKLPVPYRVEDWSICCLTWNRGATALQVEQADTVGLQGPDDAAQHRKRVRGAVGLTLFEVGALLSHRVGDMRETKDADTG